MKTLTKIELVPAEEVTVTQYGCDLCDFTSDDKEEVEKHHGKSHAVKDTVGDMMRFESEEDAKSWMSCDDFADRRRMNWTGPGWYTVKSYDEPCGRGCCRKWVLELVPAAEHLDGLRDEGRSKLREYFHIRKQLADREAARG
jgi:hypothetical protein